MDNWLDDSALVAALDAVPDAVYLIDPISSNILYCNRAGHEDLGLERGDLLHHSVLSLQKDVTGMPQWTQIAESIRQSSPYIFLGRHRHRDGHEVSVEIHTTAVTIAGHEVFLSSARNITQRVRLDADLLSRDAHVQFALNEAADGLWDWHLPTAEVFFSPQLKRMLGYGPHEMQSSLATWSDNLHPDDKPLVLQALDDHANGLRERYEAEYRLKNRNGHYLWVRDRGRVCERDGQGNATRVVGMVQNITDQKALEANLLSLATHDSLTGLRNRREAEQTLDNLLRTCQRLEVPLGVCMLDIDHFKSINDTHGHAMGDQVLVRMTEHLSASIRSTDGLFRWGGEEFLLLAPGLGPDEMGLWCEKLCEQMGSLDWTDLLPQHRLTASFGVAAMPAHGVTPTALLAAADSAMYRAKANGRNRVCVVEVAPELLALVQPVPDTATATAGPR